MGGCLGLRNASIPPSRSGRLLFVALGQTQVVSTDPKYRSDMGIVARWLWFF